MGWNISAADHQVVGRLYDFVVDKELRTTRYLVIKRSGRTKTATLVPPSFVEHTDWYRVEVHMPVHPDIILDAPACNPCQPMTADQEERLVTHYAMRLPTREKP